MHSQPFSGSSINSNMKKNILIIENDEKHFLAIKSTLDHHLSEYINVFPNTISDEENFNNNNYLIGKLIKGDFKEMLDFYKDIDLFIIDVFLLNDTDRIGIEIVKHILANVFNNFKIIVISNTGVSDPILGSKRVTRFSKLDKGIHFPKDLTEVVRKLLNEIISIEIAASKDAQSSIIPTVEQDELPAAAQEAAQEVENIAPSQTPALIPTFTQDEEFGYKLHKNWETFTYWANRVIDIMIYSSFYILLASTTIFAVVNILYKIYKAMFQSGNPIDDETNVLKTSEYIFLYLLPVFIVFGFFHYYKNNSHVSLLEGRIDSNVEENSTKTMNLTKILFLSTIISFVLIKVIEEVFFKGNVNLTNLIAYGILLLMLMTYFVLLDRKHSSSEN